MFYSEKHKRCSARVSCITTTPSYNTGRTDIVPDNAVFSWNTNQATCSQTIIRLLLEDKHLSHLQVSNWNICMLRSETAGIADKQNDFIRIITGYCIDTAVSQAPFMSFSRGQFCWVSHIVGSFSMDIANVIFDKIAFCSIPDVSTLIDLE